MNRDETLALKRSEVVHAAAAAGHLEGKVIRVQSSLYDRSEVRVHVILGTGQVILVGPEELHLPADCPQRRRQSRKERVIQTDLDLFAS